MPAKRPNPPRRTTARRAARPSLSRRVLRGSAAVLRLAGAPVVARPVLSGGIAGVVLLFAFVSGNALYAQPGRHPKPMMATRAGLLDSAPMVTGAAGTQAGNDGSLMAVPLVLEVQNALARTGHYTAALDGKPGRATEAAIRAFQAENALRVDGEPSPLLLSQIHRMMAEAPNPSARPADGERVASIDERIRAGGTAAETANDAGNDARNDAGGAGDKASDPDATASIEALPERELVRRIQSGLANAQVAPLKADGLVGEQTRAAIRTFEALEGLDVTGTPDPKILKRLIEIGAAQ